MTAFKLAVVSAGLSKPSSTRLLADRLAEATVRRLGEEGREAEVAVIELRDLAVDIANNFEDDDFRLGQFFLEDLTPKRREVTISTTLRHEDKALLRQATLGAPTATAVGGLTTKSAMVITITSYQMIGGTSTPHSLTLTFPNVVAQPFALEPSGDDILESDVEWRAVRPDMSVPVLSAELVNGVTDIA